MKTIKAKIEAETIEDLEHACEELLNAIKNGNRCGSHNYGKYWMIEYKQDLEERIKLEIE